VGARADRPPLLGAADRLYARLGDRDSVERITRVTAERVFDPSERNADRMARARFLASHPSVNKGDPGLVEVLRDVLAEEPTHKEAIELLADVYQATGNEEGLTELLIREIDAARRATTCPRCWRCRCGWASACWRQAPRARPAMSTGGRWRCARRRRPAAGAGRPAVAQGGRARAGGGAGALLDNESGAEAGRLAIELGELFEALGDDERVRRCWRPGWPDRAATRRCSSGWASSTGSATPGIAWPR
jgi:hypothetical protein